MLDSSLCSHLGWRRPQEGLALPAGEERPRIGFPIFPVCVLTTELFGE